MTEGNEFHPPKIYAIWVDARPESPMAGLSGFLSENSRRLFFTERGDAELKIRDMEALRLNRHPAAEYRCVEYPGGYDAERSIQAELLKTISLQADPEIMRYEVTDRIYGNTGGGCMVGTLAVRLPDLDKTIWINCNDEGVTITSADYVWNEDDSGSWERYEDVVMFEVNFRDDDPQSMWPLLPAIHEALAYTIQRETEYSSRLFSIPAKWLPETYRRGADPAYLKWAEEMEQSVEVGVNGLVVNDPSYRHQPQRETDTQAKVVYIASPLSGDVKRNLQFARQACRYAISEEMTPFCPHLLYTQMLDDSDPEERQLGIDMGNRMLRLCDELWLCGDRISPGMAGEKEMAERLGIPVRSVSTEEIQSMELSPTEGSLFDGIGGFPLAAERYGIKTLWASEIEPFPMKVTERRFPGMAHKGDITKLNGRLLLPVDIICGGSPCQDLSVAGARAGLSGARSGLFMEQIRIIKEMRTAERERGRTGADIRPRWMCWENVPGAFSSGSPKGEDFRIVLEEIIRIHDIGAEVPRSYPYSWPDAGDAVMENGFSLAWRCLDAQFWGVAQRRKRIFLVADFAGPLAPLLLFDVLDGRLDYAALRQRRPDDAVLSGGG